MFNPLVSVRQIAATIELVRDEPVDLQSATKTAFALLGWSIADDETNLVAYVRAEYSGWNSGACNRFRERFEVRVRDNQHIDINAAETGRWTLFRQPRLAVLLEQFRKQFELAVHEQRLSFSLAAWSEVDEFSRFSLTETKL